MEAWPGSIVVAEQGQGYPTLLHGYVLDYAGGLPDDIISLLQVVSPDEVDELRNQCEPMLQSLRVRTVGRMPAALASAAGS